MSKTMGNTINLGANEKELSAAVKSMYTDPNHLKIEDPGKVEGNVVFTYLDAFHPDVSYINQLKSVEALATAQRKKYWKSVYKIHSDR